MKFKQLAAYFQKLENTAKRLEMTDILAELFTNLDPVEKEKIDEIIYLTQGQLLPSFRNIEFGISEKLIHRAIVQATGGISNDIEAMVHQLGDYGLVAEKVCLDHLEVLSISQVYANLEKLAEFSGDGSVARKIEFLADLLKNASPLEAKYIIRIILGKLRLGVGDPTVLDSLSLAYNQDKLLRPDLERAYNLCSDLGLVAKILFTKGISSIIDFKVMVGCPIRVALAARLSGPEEIIEKIGTCAVEEKYDGFRCQVHKMGNKVQIFSRNLENTTHMFPEIIQGTLDQIKESNVIFEGEALAYDPATGQCLPFQTTVQRKRKHGIESIREKFPLKIFVFDLLYADKDLTQYAFSQRRQIMSELIKKGKVLELSPVEEVKTAQRLTEIFEDAIAQGREGIVAKRLDGEYKAGGRNFNWIKLKQSYSDNLNDTIDCVIIGYFFGKGLRAAFGIGSLLAAVYDPTVGRFKTIAKIGTGLSDDELVRFKETLDKIKINFMPKNVESLIVPDVWVDPLYVVEVQADEITQSPVHTCGKDSKDDTGYALRFPRTVGFIRIDKAAKDATTVEEIKQMFNLQGRK
ncbi:MAG: ATP-dependent DNA ligase [Candidatus Omnitrophica bacterium]|nr:ATP-dependent DNA ligase [Candidatus Omnitrophota bacterium]